MSRARATKPSTSSSARPSTPRSAATTDVVVTIVDNDPIPPGSAVLTVTGASKREGGAGTTTLTFSVTRSGETTTAVDVDFALSDGTASAPTDYTAATGNLAFVADQTDGHDRRDGARRRNPRAQRDPVPEPAEPLGRRGDLDRPGDGHHRQRRHEDERRRQGAGRPSTGWRSVAVCRPRVPASTWSFVCSGSGPARGSEWARSVPRLPGRPIATVTASPTADTRARSRAHGRDDARSSLGIRATSGSASSSATKLFRC